MSNSARPNGNEESSIPAETSGTDDAAGIESAIVTEETRPDIESTAPASRRSRLFWATTATLLLLAVVVTATGRFETLARGFVRLFEPAKTASEETRPVAPAQANRTAGVYSFEDLDIHPNALFQPYTSGQLLGGDISSATSRMITQFRNLLHLYTLRQRDDDNFSIRVVDNRTGELLELYELESERRRFESLNDKSNWDWARVDDMRRIAHRRLVQKYSTRVPSDAITIKWGRANQVLEARDREAEFIEYEIRLARYLGLSLLATEIGTVETFNQDRLVSPVGARSRYQMMPYVLRQNDVYRYAIPTASGNKIDVFEEWHPLLTMEPAFRTLSGYRNAVGHELPGISAYHTGPGNIFTVYRTFLAEASDLFTSTSTVMDAYMWAVTAGYPTVSKSSSFKSYSRGYVASIYGSLKATESVTIEPERTLTAERVQIKNGKQVFLSDLLRALDREGKDLKWRSTGEDQSLYNRFRSMNEHLVLPSQDDAQSGVSPRADLRLTAAVGGVPVRFFLPIGATEALKRAGLDVIDEASTFRFDQSTFARPRSSEITIFDRQYDELVRDVEAFGFTNENRRRLNSLVERFQTLANSNPTHYRLTRLDVIRTHQRIWNSGVFDKMAATVGAVRGSARFEPQPPSQLPSAMRRPNQFSFRN